MDREPHPSFGHADPYALTALAAYLISQKADYRAPDGQGQPPKRAVRSGVMRKFFNSPDKVISWDR